MKGFDFWQKWLLGLGLVMVCFGLALAFLSGTVVFSILDQQINPVFWKGVLPPEFTFFQRWVYAVLGATMAGWGVCVAFMAHFPFRRRERWIWNALAWAIGVWFCVDTAYSLLFRVYFNAVFNIIIFLAALAPLTFTRRHFRRSEG
jgi:hypothetical protein